MDDELVDAIQKGDLPELKLLVKAGASVAAKGGRISALMLCVRIGCPRHARVAIMEWLLTEGGANISEVDNVGTTVLLHAAKDGAADNGAEALEVVQWLLEHKGANVSDKTYEGHTVWEYLEHHLIDGYASGFIDGGDYEHDAAAVTALLKVMVLKEAPPAELTSRLSLDHRLVVEAGARLRAGLSAYLVERRTFLDTHCPLIGPLRDLVHGYEELTTTEELWATGVGTATKSPPRASATALRRSKRLRERRDE
jgi:hypothetical protein